jgi:hypothetical protein
MTLTKKALIVAVALNVLMLCHFAYSHINARQLCFDKWKDFNPQYSISRGCEICCGEHGERLNPYQKIMELQGAPAAGG